MKVLVTGGEGFIGSNLVPELRKRGHEVFVCDIINSSLNNYYRCDVSKYRQLENIFNNHRFDYVYHLAAEYGRWNGEDYYEQLWMTNVIGTKNILKHQEKHGFRLIFFSSAEVYGDYDGIMSESILDTIPIKQMNDYAITKWAGELQVVNSSAMFGTESVRVRPVNAYGPHEHYTPYRGVIPQFIYKALHDMPYTVYLNHKRIFDYVEDTCRTFANIIDNFIPGEVYNIGSQEDWETDIKTVSDLILAILGKGDRNVTYKEGEPFTTRTKKMDFSKARKDLKHEPKVPLKQGLKRTIEWMKNYYSK